MTQDDIETWVVCPSAKAEKASQAGAGWKRQGYKVAILVDSEKHRARISNADMIMVSSPYKGYWNSINALVKEIRPTPYRVFVAAADDMDPEQRYKAHEIARQYLNKFPDGFGVMQPCGDRQGIDTSGRPSAARICGSPWFGYSWAIRAFGGRGPMDDRFFHFYGDELLFEMAKSLGILWMRPELTQNHRNWVWGHQPQEDYQRRNIREFWEKDRALFYAEKEKGFPGLDPLPANVFRG